MRLTYGQSLSYATWFLNIWGENIWARVVAVERHEPTRHYSIAPEEGHEIPPSIEIVQGMYNGNVASGVYRPADDPHPNAFIILTVERILADLDHPFGDTDDADAYRSVALLYYGGKEPAGRNVRIINEIRAAVADALRTRYPDTLSEAAIAEVRRRNAQDRNRRNSTRNCDLRRKNIDTRRVFELTPARVTGTSV